MSNCLLIIFLVIEYLYKVTLIVIILNQNNSFTLLSKFCFHVKKQKASEKKLACGVWGLVTFHMPKVHMFFHLKSTSLKGTQYLGKFLNLFERACHKRHKGSLRTMVFYLPNIPFAGHSFQQEYE